jgi:hypothetical protein
MRRAGRRRIPRRLDRPPESIVFKPHHRRKIYLREMAARPTSASRGVCEPALPQIGLAELLDRADQLLTQARPSVHD